MISNETFQKLAVVGLNDISYSLNEDMTFFTDHIDILTEATFDSTKTISLTEEETSETGGKISKFIGSAHEAFKSDDSKKVTTVILGGVALLGLAVVLAGKTGKMGLVLLKKLANVISMGADKVKSTAIYQKVANAFISAGNKIKGTAVGGFLISKGTAFLKLAKSGISKASEKVQNMKAKKESYSFINEEEKVMFYETTDTELLEMEMDLDLELSSITEEEDLDLELELMTEEEDLDLELELMTEEEDLDLLELELMTEEEDLDFLSESENPFLTESLTNAVDDIELDMLSESIDELYSEFDIILSEQEDMTLDFGYNPQTNFIDGLLAESELMLQESQEYLDSEPFDFSNF